MVLAIEFARICLVLFGCATGGWAIGFGMGYTRGVNGADGADLPEAHHQVNGD
jgi:hypothetical protein